MGLGTRPCDGGDGVRLLGRLDDAVEIVLRRVLAVCQMLLASRLAGQQRDGKGGQRGGNGVHVQGKGDAGAVRPDSLERGEEALKVLLAGRVALSVELQGVTK